VDDAGPDCVRLLDDQTFETLDRFQLDSMEVCCSISSMSFADDPTIYYVVGSAISIPEEPEPTKVSSLPLVAPLLSIAYALCADASCCDARHSHAAAMRAFDQGLASLQCCPFLQGYQEY
jgi:hypothetical protein